MSSLSERLTRGAASSPSQVDHARRLVADWQLLADLAFADLTLWVPLPSGRLVVRRAGAAADRADQPPEDLRGRRGRGRRRPSRSCVAHREGRPVTEGEPDWSGGAPRRREVIPVRHDGVVVAVLAKDTNLAVTRSPSTLELTYLDIAADLCLMVSAGTFPPEKPQDAELSPRVGDGLVRLDASGRAIYASPNALSAYRRMGVDRRPRRAPTWPRLTRVGGRRPGGRRGGRRRDRRRGRRRGSPTPWTSRARAATMLVRAAAAARARRGGRRAGARARRHRRPPAGPGAAHQGRHHPRDPPPGEEQPADGGGAAAAAGAADDRAGRPGRAGGVGAAGRLDRGRARDAGRQPGGRRRRRRRARPGAADAGRPGLDRAGRAHPADRHASASCRRPRRRRWSWRSPSCCTTPPSTPSPTASRGPSSWSPSATATTSWSACGTTARGCPRASTRPRATGWGCRSCARWSPASSAAACAMGTPGRRRRAPRWCWPCPGAGLPRR